MELTGWNRETSPYHPGEQELHARLGRKDQQERVARRIHRPYLPPQHREFYEQLPFLVVGSVDREGRPWASMLFGQPGFVATPTERRLSIRATPLQGDPLADNARVGDPLGVLGIELATRRRNRVNGVVAARARGRLELDVVQSFGNCPQYIQTRELAWQNKLEPDRTAVVESFDQVGEELAALISNADTLFVASNNPREDARDTGGADVNHRGGRPGFVKVDGNTLTVPDYAGNFAFNTLGNFIVDPRAGLLFVDFESGDIWQLTGSVELLWDRPEEIEGFRGAERAWRFQLERGVCLRNAAPLRWSFGEQSPNCRLTGTWSEAAQSREAEERRLAWRPFRVRRVHAESEVIRSLYLEPVDGAGTTTHQPGQYLIIRVRPPGSEPLIRTYSLSSAPSDELYRISVKREGVVSSFLHDSVAVGDVIEVRAPTGQFHLDTRAERPAVLIAAGVGVTPMMAMVRQVLIDGFRLRHLRPLTIVHAAQTTKQRAFADELRAAEKAGDGAIRYVSVIERPGPGELEGRDFDVQGRVRPDVLQAVLPLADYDFFVCGPPAFMQVVYDMLLGLGVRDERVFSESFGPASLERRRTERDAAAAPVDVAEHATVRFSRSKLERPWQRGDGTLLELAEAHGLAPDFGCRRGDCGSCSVRLRSGTVVYPDKPLFPIGAGQVLLCRAVPSKSGATVDIDA